MEEPEHHPHAQSAPAQSTLLRYERLLTEALIEEDALCILAAGLGWQKIVSVILRLMCYDGAGPGSASGSGTGSAEPSAACKLALIVGSQPWQRDLLCQELARTDPTAAFPTDITAEVPAIERIELYQKSRCCFVTTRILVVDLLSSRLRPTGIAGMLVLNAHNVTETSKEGFAVRLYRQGNSTGFLRAFSDQPTSFLSGFNKVPPSRHRRFLPHVSSHQIRASHAVYCAKPSAC
jgi:DNA excision repair protein ERCC-4